MKVTLPTFRRATFSEIKNPTFGNNFLKYLYIDVNKEINK